MVSLSESNESWLNNDNDNNINNNDEGMDVGLEEGESEIGDSSHRKEEAKLFLAKRENKVVWLFRLLVTFVLVCVAISICVTVFLQGERNEREEFEVAFKALSEKLVSDFESALKRRVSIIESFAMELTTVVMRDPHVEWPFFTPPEYERRAGRTAELADLVSLFLLPKVSTKQKQQWEEYSRKHQGWIREGIAIRKGVNIEEVKNVNPIPPLLYHLDLEGKPETEENAGPYFPIWTEYPAFNTTFTNLNPYGTKDQGSIFISAVLKTMKPTFPVSQDFWEDPNRESHTRYQRIKSQYPDYTGDPYYISYFPVFDSLGEDKRLVALLLGSCFWRRYFENVFPEGTNEISVILENQCGQVYTYIIRGRNVQFIGRGDNHDARYDYLEVRSDLSEIFDDTPDQREGKALENNKLTIDDVNIGNCRYRIRVYPSKDFEDGFYSNEPTFYALSLGLVFVMTCSVFLLYDYVVERRQKAVLKSAVQAVKLVSSLFPEDIRNRLYEEEEEKKRTNENELDPTLDLTTTDATLRNVEETNIASSPLSSRHAIATLYQEVTVFFADLAGFTKWSSARTPVEVFDLLEKVYGEFDRLAKKFRVFKVETIGDCYVAVTGLPEARPNHAILTCRFARSCITKFHVVTASLRDALGKDTAELDLRIGLHTGPVTAGVLRGEKSRFQLFGDTVNTTSRMESNGLPGRIHCSQDTADALRRGGKGHWLTPREEKILVKGKGEMTTYWVEVKGNAFRSSKTASTQSVGTQLTDDRGDDTTNGSLSFDNISQPVLLDSKGGNITSVSFLDHSQYLMDSSVDEITLGSISFGFQSQHLLMDGGEDDNPSETIRKSSITTSGPE